MTLDNLKQLFLLLFSLFSVALFSQKNYGIVHVYPFVEERMPGNIRTDENGKPLPKGPTTVDLIFVEASSDKIQWKYAWKNGRTFLITSSRITQLPYEVGRKKSDNEKVLLSPANGNQLWQLDLHPAEKNKIAPMKADAGEIILEGFYKGKKVLRKINKQVELDVPPAV